MKLIKVLPFCIFLIFIKNAYSNEFNSNQLVISNVNVVDVETGKVISNQDVTISDKLIKSVNKYEKKKQSKESKIIDGSGKYLIPGLWDAHVHSVTNRDWHFPLMIAHGITSVRNLHTSEKEGFKLIKQIKKETESGAVIGPRFIANGYIIDGVSPMWPGTIAITDPGKVKEAVSSLKNQGADFLKVYSSIQPDIFRAIMAEAHLQNIPVDGHIPMMVDPIEAASFGMRTSEHMIGMTIGCSKDIDKVREKIQNYEKNGWGEFPQSFINFIKLRQQMARTADKERCNKVIDAYLEHQLVMTPTLINQLTWLDNNEQVKLTSDESVMSLLPESVRKDWVLMANRPPLIKEIVDYPFNVFELAAKRNVKMLAGTDIGNLFLVPGYSLLSEMILMTEQGATNLQVLQSATINPAEVFGFDSLGLIKAGYFADLVLLDANPLDDMNNIKQVNSVVRNGRYLSSKDLYALKLKAKNWKPESNQD